MPIQSTDALLSGSTSQIAWVLDPYLPASGVVLLHGKPSIGKSPLTWKMAQCVSEGLPFFHCPTTAGVVLYVDVDTPVDLVRPRLRWLSPLPRHVYWLFLPAFDILHLTMSQYADLQAGQALQPSLVIINTLRKVHRLKDRESDVSSLVYGAFRLHFPTATLLFVHHDKKTFVSKDLQTSEDEAFSGTQAFWNDATVGLHLVSAHRQDRRVRLVHTKSQVSPLRPPLHLQLAQDGTNWTEASQSAALTLWASLDPARPQEDRVAEVMHTLGISRRTVFRAIQEAVAASLPSFP